MTWTTRRTKSTTTTTETRGCYTPTTVCRQRVARQTHKHAIDSSMAQTHKRTYTQRRARPSIVKCDACAVCMHKVERGGGRCGGGVSTPVVYVRFSLSLSSVLRAHTQNASKRPTRHDAGERTSTSIHISKTDIIMICPLRQQSECINICICALCMH